MTDDALLLELAQRLEASGSTVVRFKDHLQIRLPLFASVQVRVVDGRLSCEPRFGLIPRDRATWATILGNESADGVYAHDPRRYGSTVSARRRRTAAVLLQAAARCSGRRKEA